MCLGVCAGAGAIVWPHCLKARFGHHGTSPLKHSGVCVPSSSKDKPPTTMVLAILSSYYLHSSLSPDLPISPRMSLKLEKKKSKLFSYSVLVT